MKLKKEIGYKDFAYISSDIFKAVAIEKDRQINKFGI